MLLRQFLVWASAGLLFVSSPALSRRLDTSSSNEALDNLLAFSKSICAQTPNLPGCNLADNSLERDSADLSQPQPQSADTSSVMAGHFLIHIAYINQQYKNLVIENGELQKENEKLRNRLEAVETLHLQHVSGNDTDDKKFLTDSLAVFSDGEISNLYSPSAKILRPVDCADHLMLGRTKSGVYDIYPFRCRCSEPVRVWCDMETDGGGWTVFYSRSNHSVRENFTRSWIESQQGFGNASGEFFMGNEHLHLLTSNRNYKLRVDLDLEDGSSKFGEWTTFSVFDELNKYKLSITGFQTHSMITDCLSPQINNMFFSTYDYDNDRTNNNCALVHKSGFWYNACGLFTPGNVQSNGLIQTHCPYVANAKKINIVASKIQLKIRPKLCGKSVNSAYFNTHTCLHYNFRT